MGSLTTLSASVSLLDVMGSHAYPGARTVPSTFHTSTPSSLPLEGAPLLGRTPVETSTPSLSSFCRGENGSAGRGGTGQGHRAVGRVGAQRPGPGMCRVSGPSLMRRRVHGLHLGSPPRGVPRYHRWVQAPSCVPSNRHCAREAAVGSDAAVWPLACGQMRSRCPQQ